MLLFRARADYLKLNWRRRRIVVGETTCGVFELGEEMLEHFLVECEGLESEIWGGECEAGFVFWGEGMKAYLEEAWAVRGKLQGGGI